MKLSNMTRLPCTFLYSHNYGFEFNECQEGIDSWVNVYRIRDWLKFIVATLLKKQPVFGVHKNTVGNWIKQGLPVCGKKRPFLIMGRDLRVFLEGKRVKHKQSCKADEIYCMRCRAPKKPAADLIEYKAITDALGNLVAICPDCSSIMNRRISLAKLKQNSAFMSITQPLAGLHITACVNPSVNCDFKIGTKSHA